MWGTPPEPGTAELEPGEFLAYHYTSSDEALSSILREGVKLDTSERRPTEEAAAVWGSFERPQGFKRYVEFKVRREDMWVGQPSSDEDMARAAQMGHNFTMVKNEIPVDRITTWSSPEIEDVRVWQRELADATPEWKKSVLNGAYDGVPAVDKAKQVLAKEFGSPGWAEKPSGVTDGAAIKRVSVPRVDTDRLQRRADRLRREIDDPDFVYPGARMGFRHRAAELTKIESELVKRGALEPEARRTSVVAALVPLVVELAGCQSRECAPPPVGVGGSSGSGAAAVIVPNPVVELNGLPDEVAQAVEAARRKLGALDVHESEEATALIKEAYDRAGGSLEYYAFDQGLDRASLVKAVLGIERVGFNPGGDPNWLEPTVELMAKRTRATLLGAGFSLDDRIALYRGVYDSEIDPFRMDPDGLDPEENQGGTSGITSWTTSPKLAGMYGTSLIVAAVPVRQILSWDQVGVQISRFGIGNEVLVAPESMVTNVLEGVFPAGKRIYPSQVASGVFELACRDASCAPPPVGTGGSAPGLTARVLTDDEFMSWGPHKATVSFQGEEWMKSLEVGGINRKLLSKMVKGTAPEGSEAEQATIRQVVQWTQDTLRAAGVETVTLFRGGYEDGNPFDKTSSTRKTDDPTTSGITSWTADPGGASSFRRKDGAVIFVAEVPVDNIVSWDMIGNVSSARQFYLSGGSPHVEFTGREVLVADSAHTVHKLLGGVTAAGCQSAECAPPPVGTGGSRAQGLQSGSRVRQVVVDTIEEIGEGSEESLKFGRQMLLSRQKVRGFHQLSGQNADLDPAMLAEHGALSKAVPVQPGFVRSGSAEAEALQARIREVLPSAAVGWMDDVHAESVEAVLAGVAAYPEEVRAYVKGVALGYTEAESHVAAFGPHGGGLMGPAAPGATLWLGPKAVRPAIGEANLDGASVMTTVDGFNRHRLVGAHEMGHVVHNMAAERAWKEDGIRVDLRADGYLPQDVPTTRYGGLDTGEMVAETFALAARDSFKSLEPLQQDVVVSVLDRAGLRPSDLAFAAATDEPYEVQFFGDSFEVEAAAELQASGCQSADCAPPPVGTGGSAPGRGGRLALLDGEAMDLSEMVQDQYAEIWGDIPEVIDRAYQIKDTMRAIMLQDVDQATAYQRAIEEIDTSEDYVDPDVSSRQYIDETNWWTELRGVVSATVKSETPDSDMQLMIQRMHEATREVFRREGVSHVQMARSYDPYDPSHGPMSGNDGASALYGQRIDGDVAPSSGITSWAVSSFSAQGWGGVTAEETFPVEQVLMREGSIDGEFLVGESVERVREIVGR